MEELVAVDRNHQGEIISFKTSSGRVISYRKALEEIQEGIITGVSINDTYDTEEMLPTIVDETTMTSDNFENYPPIF